MKAGLAIAVLIFGGCAFGQSKEIDSLKKTWPSLNGSARVDCMNELSARYIFISKKDSAAHYADLAYNEAERTGYLHGVAVALSHKSRISLHFDDDYIMAEAIGKEALKWFGKTGDKKDIETVYDELQSALISQSQYDEAYQYALKKFEHSKEVGDQYEEYDALSGFADIHYFKGNYDSAYYFYQRARQIAVAANNEAWQSGILFNFGALYRAIEDYPTALSYYRQAFQKDNPSNIKFRIDTDWDIWVRMEFAELFSLLRQYDSAWHYYHLFDTAGATQKNLRAYLVSTGELYLLQKDYSKALQNFLRGLASNRKLNDAIAINRTLLDIAKTYFYLNDNSAALKYAREGISLALRTKSKPFIRDGYQVLYSVYDRLQKTDSAYFYYEE
ncbi:MAG: tetratricopeptide repeat protein, partial [Bacteroidetes bacterium]|nr:tetratricopeptide repeat protein [Bacteroidota bacterium]